MSSIFDDAGLLASIAVAGTAVCTAGIWLSRRLFKFTKRVGNFLDDFMGTPPRPGVPEVPGVMVRLQTLTETQAELAADRAHVQAALVRQTAETKGLLVGFGDRLDSLQAQVADIHHETQPNNGSSMNDKLTRVDQRLAEGD